MDNPTYQSTKAGPPEGIRLRPGTSRTDKFQASFIAIMKMLSSLVLVLVLYGAIRHFNPGLWGGLLGVGPGEGLAGNKDWKNEIGKGSKYLLGVGKADITG
jgi:hypothetical protein